MSIFKGAAVAIVTPFFEDGSVDYDKFGELIEFQIANKTDAIVVCGTTGEASTLTHEEHLDVIKYCAEKVNKRVPVIAGTGSNCTETAIYLSTEAEKYGVDGLLIVTPYYNKATQNGLYRHYKLIADSVKLPIILYNVPSRTGTNLNPETIVRLCKDVENSGNDDQIVPILSLGGLGVISVLSNVAPAQTHDICAKFFEGDVKESCRLQLEAIPLINALFCEVNPIPVKKGVEMMGLCGGTLRMPLTEMEPANAARLQKAMQEYGIL